MEFFKLNNGTQMPMAGIGCLPLHPLKRRLPLKARSGMAFG